MKPEEDELDKDGPFPGCEAFHGMKPGDDLFGRGIPEDLTEAQQEQFNREAMQRDFERMIYKQCDEEKSKEES